MSDHLTLGFDTSAAHCAAALLCGDRVLATAHEDMGRGQAERLFPLLDEMLRDAGTTWAGLARIAVGIGPGNFTGIRIAVAAARGLALSLDIPVIGVSTFAARALDLPRPVVALIRAPRDRVYLQRFDAVGPAAPQLVALDEIAALELPRDMAFVGDHADDVAQAVSGRAVAARHPLAVAMARVADLTDADNTPLPAPLYLRPADAAPPRDAPPVIVP